METQKGGGDKGFKDFFSGGLMTSGFMPTLKQPFAETGAQNTSLFQSYEGCVGSKTVKGCRFQRTRQTAVE